VRPTLSKRGKGQGSLLLALEDHILHKLRRYRLGLALFLSALTMLFVAFCSAYVVRRGIPTYDLSTDTYSTVWEPLQLPAGFLIGASILLLGASAAMEIARRAEAPRMSSLAAFAAAMLGLGFVLVQGLVWSGFKLKGVSIGSGSHAAFFYVFTGTHAALTALGIIALLVVVLWRTMHVSQVQIIAIDLGAWYMHFLTVLWIYLFVFLTFA
jgi:cytochrome c oxidase subunit 3